MYFYTFYILPSAHSLVMFRDLAPLLIVLNVCTMGGKRDFGVRRGTMGKGDLSTCYPQIINLL